MNALMPMPPGMTPAGDHASTATMAWPFGTSCPRKPSLSKLPVTLWLSAARRAATGALRDVSSTAFTVTSVTAGRPPTPGHSGQTHLQTFQSLARSETLANLGVSSQGVYAAGRGWGVARPRYTAGQEDSPADETNRDDPASGCRPP